MKWLLLLITSFFLYFPVPSYAAEWQFDLTTPAVDAFYDMYFEISSSGGSGAAYDLRTAAETRSNVWVTALPTHFWLKARSDEVKLAHLIVYTSSNRTPTITQLRVQPYQSWDGQYYSQIASFFVGALTSIAFVVAVDSAWRGGSV